MQIEFNGDAYDVNVTSSTPYVAGISRKVEFSINLDGVDISKSHFTKAEFSEIESKIFEKLAE